MRKVSFAALLMLTAIVALFAAAGAAAKQNPAQRIRPDLRMFSQIVGIAPEDAEGGVGPGQQGRRQEFCGNFGEAGRGIFDKDISCDDPFAPDNETAMAVHPENPDLLLGGSNDYQIQFVGATSIVQVPSGWFLSKDGGTNWTDGELPLKGSLGGGDPVPEFDVKHSQMVFASLSFVCGQFAPLCARGNIMFASSKLDPSTDAPVDEQITWSDQIVAEGSGSDASAQQIFLDKEWMAVDNNRSSPHFGNIYITFSRFRLEKGAYDESPIWFVMSEDGGNRWTLPVEISGRNPRFCTFQDDSDDTADTNGPNSSQGNAEGPDDPFACDQDQFSIPVVAPNGDLYIHFHNEQNFAAYEHPQKYDSQIMVVKSTDGGKTFSGEQPTNTNQDGCVRQEGAARGTPSGTFQNPCIVPIHIVDMEDSYDSAQATGLNPIFPDYPLSASGRTTLTGHQFRVNSAGNMTVGPNPTATTTGEEAYRLWVTFADNLHGVRPGVAAFAGTVITDTEIYYAYSDDGGMTWTGGDAGANSNPLTRLMVHPEDGAASPGNPLGIDQWFPWSDVDSAGNLQVGYMDASVDGPVRDMYGFSHATVGANGLPIGVVRLVSSRNSEPNRSRFFRARVASCFDCSTFIGDYNGLVVDSRDRIHSTWTDMRRTLAFVNRPLGCDTDPTTAAPPCIPVGLKGEDAFYAREPAPGGGVPTPPEEPPLP